MARQDLRVVEVLTLTRSARDEVVGILEENELDYVVTDESGDDGESATVSFPLPTQTVEHVQTSLEALDVDDELYTIVVDPEAVVSDRFGDADDPYHQVRGLGYQGISRSELIATATDLVPNRTIYLLMTAISAIVATAGVLLNSLSVLVGSMVIAPLIGPLMATSVSTVLDEPALYDRSLRYQFQGGAVAIGSAVGFATLVKFTDLVSTGFDVSDLLKVSSQTAPSFLLVVVAFGAGFAGALGLSTSGTIDLVGVMIAAAVMPPIGVLIQMLRRSENLPWKYRKWSFAMAIVSVVSFIGTGALVAAYLVINTNPPALLSTGLVLAIVGLIPFSLFTGILYKEHRLTFGP